MLRKAKVQKRSTPKQGTPKKPPTVDLDSRLALQELRVISRKLTQLGETLDRISEGVSSLKPPPLLVVDPPPPGYDMVDAPHLDREVKTPPAPAAPAEATPEEAPDIGVNGAS